MTPGDLGAGLRQLAEPTALGGPSERLAAPLLGAGFARLPALWRTTEILIACRWPQGAETGAWLNYALRAAWGYGLARSIARRQADGIADNGPFQAAGALDAFFATLGMVKHQHHIPKPFVISTWPEGDRLMVRLRLFGFAEAWREVAIDGMIEALTGGVRITSFSRMRHPVAPVDARWTRTETVEVPAGPAGRATLIFETPLNLDAGRRLKADLGGLLPSLMWRLCGLARWQDIEVEEDWAAINAAARRLDWNAEGLRPVAWLRGSGRDGGKAIPMHGYLGKLTLEGDLAPFLPVLAVGAVTGAGGNAALGLGQYDLIVEP